MEPDLFHILPVVALAAALTAALYVPMAGFNPPSAFDGDLVVAIYMLSVLTLCMAWPGPTPSTAFH